MGVGRGVEFFDTQFRNASGEAALALNPFELQTLPHLNGEVLDLGCGLGNLACAAARQGCRVTAVDASPAAIQRLHARAAAEALAVTATEADLRDYPIHGEYDAIVAIGLLMFFDCDIARRSLETIQAGVRPGGIAAVNVLIEGTTFMDMFEPDHHCLFPAGELSERFAAWEVLHHDIRDFPAPRDTVKRFATVIARKPASAAEEAPISAAVPMAIEPAADTPSPATSGLQ